MRIKKIESLGKDGLWEGCWWCSWRTHSVKAWWRCMCSSASNLSNVWEKRIPQVRHLPNRICWFKLWLCILSLYSKCSARGLAPPPGCCTSRSPSGRKRLACPGRWWLPTCPAPKELLPQPTRDVSGVADMTTSGGGWQDAPLRTARWLADLWPGRKSLWVKFTGRKKWEHKWARNTWEAD